MLKYVFAALVAVLIALGVGYYLGYDRGWESAVEELVTAESPASREVDPAILTLAVCKATCREQYGGSGSAGFDACMRACGTGESARGAAAPAP